jgi:hypothetical protein
VDAEGEGCGGGVVGEFGGVVCVWVEDGEGGVRRGTPITIDAMSQI